MAEMELEKPKQTKEFQKPGKTTLRKTAEISLTTKDLIHPHEYSNLPG